jgi:predicted nucleic acid-binding protein
MITAVDTNVLLDIFAADEQFGEASRELMRRCRAEGSLTACEVVWTELGPSFDSREALTGVMALLGVDFSSINLETALKAGDAWKARQRQAHPRPRVVADFLIGAHALVQADRLLTRDRGFYRTYFEGLPILDPAAAEQ